MDRGVPTEDETRQARSKAPAASRLVDVAIDKERPSFTFALNRTKLKRRDDALSAAHQSTDNDPAQLWQYYIQLVAIEEAFAISG
jgi:hypothetical protein